MRWRAWVDMYVYVVLGHRGFDPPYILALFIGEHAAHAYMDRWLRLHPGTSAEIRRYAVVDAGN